MNGLGAGAAGPDQPAPQGSPPGFVAVTTPHPQVQALAVDHVRCTTDIDTEFDLARIAAEHGVRLAWPDGS